MEKGKNKKLPLVRKMLGEIRFNLAYSDTNYCHYNYYL